MSAITKQQTGFSGQSRCQSASPSINLFVGQSPAPLCFPISFHMNRLTAARVERGGLVVTETHEQDSQVAAGSVQRKAHHQKLYSCEPGENPLPLMTLAGRPGWTPKPAKLKWGEKRFTTENCTHSIIHTHRVWRKM